MTKQELITESYWQRGCNDGYAGAPRQLPNDNGPDDPGNRGYRNGWRFGSMKRTIEQRSGAPDADNDPKGGA